MKFLAEHPATGGTSIPLCEVEDASSVARGCWERGCHQARPWHRSSELAGALVAGLGRPLQRHSLLETPQVSILLVPILYITSRLGKKHVFSAAKSKEIIYRCYRKP